MSVRSVPLNFKNLLLFISSLIFIYIIYWIGKQQTSSFQFPKNEPSNRKIIIYNRIPKTGSTTLTNSIAYDLCRINDFNVIHVNTSKNNYLMNTVDQLSFIQNTSTWTERLPAFYHGHLAFVDFTKYGFANPLYINLIREPIDRLLSYYYFLRYGDNFRVGLKRSKAGNKETFDECFKRRGKDCDPEKFWLQIPYFCGNSHFCRIPGNKLALETAKRHLIENYLIVGYTDRLTDLISVLETLLPEFFAGASQHYKNLPDSKAKLRTTLNKSQPAPETLALLKADPIYLMEREFYDFAVQEFNNLFDRLFDSSNNKLLPQQYRYEKIQP